MFKSISGVFNPANKDLRKRIYFTLFCLAIFSLGSHITLPWASVIYEELGFLELFNLMSGGGLRQFSIFALGVSPYITASIITQLLQMDIVPYFKELKEQGYTGKQKINKITRYLGILFALVNSYVITIAFQGMTDFTIILKTTITMTAGTAFLLWMGDQITKKGIGNGISLLIMAGIIQSLPHMFTVAFGSMVTEGANQALGISLFSGYVLIYLLVIVGVIWVQLAERRVPIQYSNRTTSAYGGQQSFLPIKLNSAGVIPVIFASTLITVPITIATFMGNEGAVNFINNYIDYTSLTGFFLYIALIFFFAYFYTFMQMNPEDMSKNLNKNGGYIPGVRPGAETSKHISNVLGKLTIVGATFLVIIAGLPIVFSAFSGLPTSVTLGGTGLLIVVGVAIETYKQLESSLVSRSYKRTKRVRP